MHTAIQAGALVTARGRPWVLRALVPRADCRELHLEPAAGHLGASPEGPVVLLEPFDRPRAAGRPGRARAVSRRAWMAALRAALRDQRGAGSLWAAASASLDILPHQLEPALAVVCHGARRLLLADAVGLGKTIEAGLILAELRARSILDRALVLSPPGLRDQWCAELGDRFGLEAVVADAGWLRCLRPILPRGLNPWSIPGIRIASLDFAKRPEVRRGIQLVPWDVVVVDEAHGAAGDSERRAAAHAFASRARFVLLLTATPHSGNSRTFRALCGIGALPAGVVTTSSRGEPLPAAAESAVHPRDPLVMFRRTREEAGILRRRRVHLHRVWPSPAEAEVRRRLDDYITSVWVNRSGAAGRDARLAMVVLLKRSLSGMGPLRRSLVTRVERLGTVAGPYQVQLPLLWEEQDEADAPPAAALGAPGLGDLREERRVLRALADGAAFAEAHDSKKRALARILARVTEPAIVFTEYRDTLEALHEALRADAVLLHGAMDRFERAAAVRRFTSGGARVLLATDAAGEGLNLQARCRLVINLELPWNPMRLEQRIGRVDRIGQPRAVHAINLVAAGSAEPGVLARLARRLDRARNTVGAIDDLLGRSDEHVLAASLGLDDSAGDMGARRAPTHPADVPSSVRRIDLGGAARDEAARLGRHRQFLGPTRAGRRADLPGCMLDRKPGVLATAISTARSPLEPGRGGLLAVFRVRSAAHAGLGQHDAIVPVFAEGPCPRLRRSRDVRALASEALSTLVPAMAGAIQARVERAARPDPGSDRAARLASRAQARRPVQRGLFERRAERAADEEAAGAGPADGPSGAPQDEAPATPVPEPVLLMFVTS